MDMDDLVRDTEKILTDEEAAARAAKKAKARAARKKKKLRQRRIRNTLLIILVVVLVLAAAAAGFLFYLQKCTGTYDNITECVQSKAMEPIDRYSFSAGDNTVTMKLDKNDIWWLLYQTGAVEKLEAMDAALSNANIRLTGMGVDTTGSDISASAELTCLGNIKLPLIASCGIAVSDTDISLNVKEVKLGNGWVLPLRQLCSLFDTDPSALSVQMSRSIHPCLESLKNIEVTGGNVVVTLDASGAMMCETSANPDTVKNAALYGVECAALDAVQSGSPSSPEFAAAVSSFSTDVNAYAAFRIGALALTDEAVSTGYMTGGYAPYVQRFLPGLTLDSVNSLRQEIVNISAEREQLLETLATNLNDAYTRGTVIDPSIAPAPESEEDGKKKDRDDEKKKEEAAPTPVEPAASFVNASIADKPAVTMEQIASGNWAAYSQWLAEADFKPVYLVAYPNTTVEVQPEAKQEDTDTKKKDRDKKKEEEQDQATAKTTVTTPAKPIGLLVRMKDRSFRLFYHTAALAEGSTSQIKYTIAYHDMDAATGEGYMIQSVIPSVPYDAAIAAPIATASEATVVPVDEPASAPAA